MNVPIPASQGRKASTQSLNNPLPMHKQTKRMSVPTMPSGEVPLTNMTRNNTANSMRKVGVGGDLKGIEEIDEADESNLGMMT